MNNNKKYKILFIYDDNIGNIKQLDYIKKNIQAQLDFKNKILIHNLHISCNKLAKLPNYIIDIFKLNIINNSNINKLLKNNLDYKYIINAGRRSAIISVQIKKYIIKKNLKAKIKLISLMNPDYNFNYFHKIILPYHDNISFIKRIIYNINKKKNNIIRSIGSISLLNNDIIEEYYINNKDKITKNIHNILLNNNIEKITLIIGGDIKNKLHMNLNYIENLVNLLKDYLVNNKNKFLFIISSRRTSNIIRNYLSSIRDDQIYYNDFHDNRINLYLIMTKFSNDFIVTADSISMISEILSINKNIYLSVNNNILTKKHINFTNYLINNNYALLFNDLFIKNKNNNLSKINFNLDINDVITL